MTTLQRIALTVALGALPGICAARPAPRHTAKATRHRAAPPLSYLKENSFSLEELIRQVTEDRQLQLRYANHFHITPEQVVPYFRANLVESYVAHTQRFPVWMKRKDGTTFWRYQTFKAGERVLALKNGEPVLKWACGNPLTTKLPVITKKIIVKRRSRVLPNVQERERSVEVETPFETPRKLMAVAPLYEGLPSNMSRMVTRSLAHAPGVRFPGEALIPLAFLPRGGGGGEIPPPNSIPEPSSLALALTGLAGMSGMFRRRRAS
jgi:hypothetical protein